MTEELERADNDSPWKEILEAYFPQAMQFFFPLGLNPDKMGQPSSEGIVGCCGSLIQGCPILSSFCETQTAALINWERPHEFLDKEFQQIAREAEQGRRYADKLVKVWQIQGQEIWLLIHVEIQAKSEDTFAQRMFDYNLRIFDRFAKPAMSLAILCDTDPTWRPNQYSYNYPDTRLNFEFGTVKLLDPSKSLDRIRSQR
jgi:hypothetical protein